MGVIGGRLAARTRYSANNGANASAVVAAAAGCAVVATRGAYKRMQMACGRPNDGSAIRLES